ncbi:MAG: hypothetical protein ACYTGF_07670 [Planctomycetota bacterium]
MKWCAAVAAGMVLYAQAVGGVAAMHPACPGDRDCCVVHDTPGCDDEDCCNIVCAVDPFCCEVEWDQICVGHVDELCGFGCPPVTCTLDCPPEALDEGEPCGEDTNGGCDSTSPVFTDATCGDTFCGTMWAGAGTRDTDWYLVDHPGGSLIGFLASDFPGVCFIVDGIDTCSPVVVGDIGCGDHCSNIAVASADLSPGNYVVFVSLGTCSGGGIFEGFPCGSGFNDYLLEIACEPCLGDCEVTPDGIVGIVDFLALLGQWGNPGSCDFDGNGVSVTDFLILLANWGLCY